jgi:DNA repair protein RecN (Recombination protein N)
VEERRSFLLFQLNEMIHVQLQDGELETLRARKARLTHGTRLAELVDQTLGHLRDHEEAALQRLQSGAGTLATGVRFDASLEEMVAAIQSLQYELESVIERIGQYRQGLEIDPAELEQVDERLDHINRLCRKHRCEADELVRLVGKWQQELADLDHIEEQEKTLERELLLLQQRYDQEAARLSQARAAIAIQLTEQVTRQLQDLYMPHTRFAVQQTLHGKGPRQTGDDQIEFLISTNPGEPVKPLRQVASGGELARIMLALKSVLANAVAIGTLIFDEVDTGISGRVAASVGDKLQQIARQNRQVIAITHLPQVAAWGDHHVKVAKEVWTSDDAMATTGASMTSRVTVHGLTPPERVEELARLLAGEQVTEPARINARELLEHARQPRE